MPINAAPNHIVRYPQSLSQRPGPSHVNRPKRPVKAPHPLPESIDDTVPPIVPLPQVPMVPAHKYSSLADLLQKAGYKETRVYTPESEKRRIKRTLEEDDEINALYGTFGLAMNGNGRIHTRQEPSQPMKSSSSLLRRLALQDLAENSTPTKASESRSTSDGWWSGGLSASLGRAAKAVVEPTVSGSTPPPPLNLPPVGQARTSEVKRVKSKWDLERGRRSITEEPDQEQRPPRPMSHKSRALTESPKRNPVFEAPPPLPTAVESKPPAASAIFDDDAFGFSPLPVDYEEQYEGDVYSGADPFQVGSLGTFSSASDAASGIILDRTGQSLQTGTFEGGGKSIMVDAVEYDEDFDSPTQRTVPLPEVDVEPTTPQESEVEPEPAPRPRKYADRATRLRVAQSTPALKRQPSWMDMIRDTVLARAGYQRIVVEEEAPVSLPRIPVRISPAVPAPPTLVTTSAVICDSVCAEAIDLPAIPASITAAAAPSPGPIPLRLRSSLAALRSAVGLPERETIEDDVAPVLRPRLDWQSQGTQYAGWEKGKNTPKSSRVGGSPTKRMTSGSTIDYSKSFFYKPTTPPHPSHQENGDPDSTPAPPPSKDEPTLGKRRSIKSLRAALQIPMAPVPALPASYRSDACPSTPRGSARLPLQPPVLAILSPGAWEAGLPPRELVLEGEEWDARDGGAPGDWGRRTTKGRKKLRKRRSIHADDDGF